MPAPESISIRAGLGPICTDDIVVAGAITTTPIKPVLQQPGDAPGQLGMNRTLKVKIVNPNTTAIIAWALLPRGAATPGVGALVATFAPNAGSHILPGTVETFSFDASMYELFLVADAAGNYSVTSIAF